MRKKNGYVFLGVPVVEKKKKRMCEKRKKKWCRNLLGYRPTVSQDNGKLHCDIADFWECKMAGECVTIQPLYRDMVG